MVEKALKNKKLGKKTVSFDKSVTYSDDPQPQPQGILVTAKSKQQQSQGELEFMKFQNGKSTLYIVIKDLHRVINVLHS